ncbi:hypothetical protein ACKWTF_014236 [Chironomus riparius]
MLKLLVLLSVIQIIYGFPTSGKKDDGISYARQTDGPWTVMLVVKGSRCTGSLIKKKYVVTAAHCFDELEDDKSLSNDIKIFIGEWKVGIDPDCTDSEEENFSEETCFPDKVAEIPPKKLTIHKEYLKKKGTAGKSAYDIAIIELKRPPRVSKIIKSIDLPSEDTCEDEPDHPLMVTGFGKGLFTYDILKKHLIFRPPSPSRNQHAQRKQHKVNRTPTRYPPPPCDVQSKKKIIIIPRF